MNLKIPKHLVAQRCSEALMKSGAMLQNLFATSLLFSSGASFLQLGWEIQYRVVPTENTLFYYRKKLCTFWGS